jgi:poly(A) polymerase
MEADGPGREELLARKPRLETETAAAPKKRARRRRPKGEAVAGPGGE